MNTKIAFNDLSSFLGNVFQRAPARDCLLQDRSPERIDGRRCEPRNAKDKGNSLSQLLELFFPAGWEETFHNREGKDIPPILIVRLGNMYTAAEDSRRHFDSVRHEGRTYLQAEK